MWHPTDAQWRWLAVVAMLIVFAWPARGDRSLAMKFVNWAVDPLDELPVLPPQLGLGAGDDFVAVSERDALVRHYDELYQEGGWTRRRLLLKVADDPLPPSTTRQLLAGLGVLTVFLVWKSHLRKQ